jgi:hypothetical protein
LHCLPSLQHNMIPSGFVPFNHGYPIRFEAIGFLWSLVLALQSPSGPVASPTSAAGTPSIMSPRNGAGSPSPLSDSFGRSRGSGVTARGVEGVALGPAQVLLAEVAHRVAKSGLVASERLRLWKLRDAALQVRSRTSFRNTASIPNPRACPHPQPRRTVQRGCFFFLGLRQCCGRCPRISPLPFPSRSSSLAMACLPLAPTAASLLSTSFRSFVHRLLAGLCLLVIPGVCGERAALREPPSRLHRGRAAAWCGCAPCRPVPAPAPHLHRHLACDPAARQSCPGLAAVASHPHPLHCHGRPTGAGVIPRHPLHHPLHRPAPASLQPEPVQWSWGKPRHQYSPWPPHGHSTAASLPASQRVQYWCPRQCTWTSTAWDGHTCPGAKAG